MINILISLILLAFALAGFWFLDATKAVLWLLFLLIAYPPALATTAVDRWDDKSAIAIYKAGMSQIPILGSLLRKL